MQSCQWRLYGVTFANKTAIGEAKTEPEVRILSLPPNNYHCGGHSGVSATTAFIRAKPVFATGVTGGPRDEATSHAALNKIRHFTVQSPDENEN